ncbi:beta-lactamase [Pseudarthrobacter chlorophenolicus A6]|uniref:Beta-lactamase n=1 Tax=Pseudarthrobacter chlorophenolicus (strain ATCC 700700 / DSM 12829 / CIP 107037 / JCM 12360 / KCTC 9906 / NCIMB 13794 / A6) TaxID=452863 RepID=B8HE23_PSECP|nr:serine hydrolase [Pseudarthrobacter chlorophenolicus]ACL39058.1 beta-lactamase [Pseudarthrobacter chlorophenolicus A6]SDR04966.1 CubicO group peptidase, beta-lactamase class C family [Pseudarthrobacter chlorophenolicus]
MTSGSVFPTRRTVLKTAGIGAAGVPLLAAGNAPRQQTASVPSALLPAPPGQVPPRLDRAKVDRALERLDDLAGYVLAETGLPGLAVAVVYQDEVLYAKGFGVREVGKPAQVTPETVFQVASVSKPLASTVIAGVVGRKVVAWTDPVIKYNRDFALNNDYVTRNATFADLLSHRSGLQTGAGDLLEDLGFDRDYILSHLHQQPLDAFRSSYHYSNFGYTEGGQAAADAMDTPWEDLADKLLFGPLGMASSSYRLADYEKAANRAVLHVPVGDKQWAAKYRRDPDAEAPAGGASSSVRDLAQWLRLQLGNGTYAGTPLIDAAALQTTRVPHSVSGPAAAPAARSRFYGLGWNVSYDDEGRVQLGHSGAFNLGAATAVSMLPGEQLAIVTLTNGRPQGIPEAINADFMDTAQNGAPTVDWLPFIAGIFRQQDEADKPEIDYGKLPANPTSAGPNRRYTGTYANSYYGPLMVFEQDGGLAMRMGPDGNQTTFPLTHFDGDTFSFESIGENGNGLAGAVFAEPRRGSSQEVVLDFYNRTGLGTFTRRAR